MRPGTVYYAVTVENSITHGRHFYNTATIRDSAFAVVQCSILDSLVSNPNHPPVRTLLRRLYSYWLTQWQADQKPFDNATGDRLRACCVQSR